MLFTREFKFLKSFRRQQNNQKDIGCSGEYVDTRDCLGEFPTQEVVGTHGSDMASVPFSCGLADLLLLCCMNPRPLFLASVSISDKCEKHLKFCTSTIL